MCSLKAGNKEIRMRNMKKTIDIQTDRMRERGGVEEIERGESEA